MSAGVVALVGAAVCSFLLGAALLGFAVGCSVGAGVSDDHRGWSDLDLVGLSDDDHDDRAVRLNNGTCSGRVEYYDGAAYHDDFRCPGHLVNDVQLDHDDHRGASV